MSLPIFSMNKKVIDTLAMTANITPSSIDIAEVGCYAVHAIWTGSPAGNIIIEASNDNTNFFTLVTQAAGGAPSQYLYNVERAAYRYVRVKYVFTSSTGVLTVYVSGKDI